MSTETLAKQLHQEMSLLRQDVAEMKTILLKIFDIPEESLQDYENESAVIKSLRNAQKEFPRKL